jgi:hypothetical protein
MNAAIRFAMIAGAGMLAATVAATDASAQDLSGRYRCVTLCEGGLQGQPAFVTQNGSQLNLLNEAGEPSRAWIDWPGHIWADRWQEGALYTNDGMAIHFDRGTIWERDLGEPPPPPPPAVIVVPGKHRPVKEKRVEAPAAPPPVSVHSAPVSVHPAPAPVSSAFDGDWSVLISTQAGPCDRSYRYGVRIANGDVYYDGGGPVDVQGHVFSNGIVRVSVDGMGQHADGQGRLARGLGNGTWQGGGSLGSCAGVWQAERRG